MTKRTVGSSAARVLLSIVALCALAAPLLAASVSAESRVPSPGTPADGEIRADSSGPTGTPRLPDAEAGRRIFAATGGCTCHTNYPGEGDTAPLLAGGRALETPFGVYYSSNITPDRETGIGDWTDADFIRAMREGLSPEGEHYFPVFPYTSFTGLSRQDLIDMKAYLDSLPAIRRENRSPGAIFPFSWRATIAGWKLMNFTPGRIEPDPERSDAWNRGRYLVEAAAHCGECHTPRTLTGGLDGSMRLAGSLEGPEGELAPNITPDDRTGIGSWSKPDLVWYLETGLKPDGDDTQGLMSEVIEHGYANLPADDLEAIATYLATVPAIENEVRGN